MPRKQKKVPWEPSSSSDHNIFLAISYLKVTLILPMKFRVNWPFGSGEKVQKDFENGSYGNHLGF